MDCLSHPGSDSLHVVRTLGLTGGIGTGKSTLAGLLRSRGIPLVDTDDLARSLVEPGQPALTEIRAVFGDRVIDERGRLRRDALAEQVFSDQEARLRLELILHPRIHAAWQGQLVSWQREGLSHAVVVIPLLFEKRLETHFNLTLCVACRSSTQRDRLRARGWSDRDIERRLEAQLSLAEKMRRADRVIWNEGSLGLLAEQADRILAGEGLPRRNAA
jgi:dephospho-CoA kinase